ncbi:hypothetical protein [Argonema antarcticum]|uniref:hypothetical protein n=1 Tax=Argonema antarcticum TaxID=2942763 RepID=UPI0020137E4A|nr:hypothetical protein [Argonema antarcticum]MCL1471547.1 hypothetical protein [Argonema antarcticum A004/B2]
MTTDNFSHHAYATDATGHDIKSESCYIFDCIGMHVGIFNSYSNRSRQLGRS